MILPTIQQNNTVVKMRTPRKNMKARSAVTSRKSSPASPVWTSAKDVFKSPKSPSPVRRVTRRTSVYQAKRSDASNFKMPLPKVLSPPGVKTRARRSSIYQKGGPRLISPPKATRTRRTSMYISSKSKPETVNVFSKVWATPVRQPEAVAEIPAEKPIEKKTSTQKTYKAHKSPNRSVSSVVEKKPRRSISPRKTTKTPKAANKSKATESKGEAASSTSPKKSSKTPKSVNKSRGTAAGKTDTQKQSEEKHHKTPVSRKKSSPTRTNPNLLKTPGTKSAKKSPKPRTGRKPSPVSKVNARSVLVTSTPTKSLEQISGKSFYSTPGETPIPSQRNDDVFVFSAKPVKSAKRSLKKSVHIGSTETPEQKTKSPKRMPTRKTPAVKRSRENDSTDFDVIQVKSPSLKRVKATPSTRTIKSVKRSVKKSSAEVVSSNEPVKLSPVEMSSVLKSVVRTEKRRASKSPSPRRTKRAKVSDSELQTPRVIKTVKRASPKKLAEMVSISQNTNNNSESDGSKLNMSLLNDTVNTDSRSSRCIIL